MLDKLSIYIPKKKAAQRPIERLNKIAGKKDRSVNYLVVEAILHYLDRERSSSSGPAWESWATSCPALSPSVHSMGAV